MLRVCEPSTGNMWDSELPVLMNFCSGTGEKFLRHSEGCLYCNVNRNTFSENKNMFIVRWKKLFLIKLLFTRNIIFSKWQLRQSFLKNLQLAQWVSTAIIKEDVPPCGRMRNYLKFWQTNSSHYICFLAFGRIELTRLLFHLCPSTIDTCRRSFCNIWNLQ